MRAPAFFGALAREIYAEIGRKPCVAALFAENEQAPRQAVRRLLERISSASGKGEVIGASPLALEFTDMIFLRADRYPRWRGRGGEKLAADLAALVARASRPQGSVA